MVSGSVNALHVALAAAIVGWIVCSLRHAVAVWKRRRDGGTGGRSYALLYVALLVCCLGTTAGWLNRELTRRAGVIAGTDLFVVRAHSGSTTYLSAADKFTEGAALAHYDSADANRSAQRLRNQIAVFEEQMHVKLLEPLTLNPELLRISQQQSDDERARLTQLGFGVLTSDAAQQAAAREGQMLAAQRARNDAAIVELERTRSLVNDGVLPRQRLDAAASAAAAASQELRERQQLISDASVGSIRLVRSEQAIQRDGIRAGAERSAEVAELMARTTELRDDLQQLTGQQSVQAPFNGTVVYRHPSPALASPGQVVLALARGAGFVATIEVPAREAAMLHSGQPLSMKLQHSLVSEEVQGRLVSTEPVTDTEGRADLLIACNLPREQFAAFSSGSVPVTLQWRPALLAEPLTRGGIAAAALFLVIWLVLQLRQAWHPDRNEPAADDVDRVLAELGRHAEPMTGAAR